MTECMIGMILGTLGGLYLGKMANKAGVLNTITKYLDEKIDQVDKGESMDYHKSFYELIHTIQKDM